jgi:hypothetical protein
LGLDDWNCIDGILHCFILVSQYLGLNQSGGLNTGIVGFFDPLSFVLNGKAASQWFVYEHIYSSNFRLGYKFILKYRQQ